MATTTSSTSTGQPSSIGSQIFYGIYEIGVSAGVGALAGHVFSIINPVGGVIFGATFACLKLFGDALADKLSMDGTVLKTVAYIVSFIASAGIGTFAATAAGFPITILGAAAMTLTTFVGAYVMRKFVSCAACFAFGPGVNWE